MKKINFSSLLLFLERFFDDREFRIIFIFGSLFLESFLFIYMSYKHNIINESNNYGK